MSRVQLLGIAVIAAGVQLAGCSGSSTSAVLSASPPTKPLQFESVPPGADVSTADGQTCKTPCSLALPLAGQAVNFAMNGYAPQTVSVQVHQDNIFSPDVFTPNPVSVTLQAAPKPTVRPKPRQAPARPRVAAKPAAVPQAPAMTPTPAPAPAAAPPPDNAFPAPPPVQSPVESRFPTNMQQQPAR